MKKMLQTCTCDSFSTFMRVSGHTQQIDMVLLYVIKKKKMVAPTEMLGSTEQQAAGFAVWWLPFIQSAGRRLRERHRPFIFACPIHVRVRRQVVKRRPRSDT